MKINAALIKITDYMQAKYNCHTVIVYGSHARREANSTSDYDIIAVRSEGEFQRDCEIFDGFYLDAFIYSESMIASPDRSLIRIKDGIILCQKDNIGDELLKKVKEIFNIGPEKTPQWEKHEIITWVDKMLIRSKQEDIEGNFRRHWLLHDLLECYFKLRDQWYLGPKESFQWIKINDFVTYEAFSEALVPNADINLIEILIKRVIAEK